MHIGSKIKQLRHKARLTQEQLANLIGVSAQAVSKWENGTTMPDITLLPVLSTEFGVTIDELFDLSIEQKLQRIERRMDLEESFSQETFLEYEDFLKNMEREYHDRQKVLCLLAHLYHHRMQSDAQKVSKYARESIMLAPEKKDCQWLLQKADGATTWDWNIANHSDVIDFYKGVIKADTVSPQTPMPYYELMDNLIADHRTKEAKYYLEKYKQLPAHKPFLVPIYEAYIALAEYDAEAADRIMSEALEKFSCESSFLFESAQYHARRCNYDLAIDFYERSWCADENKKPRYTDALDGMAIIYTITGNKDKAIKTYERMIECIKEEWGYKSEDAAVTEVERKISALNS